MKKSCRGSSFFVGKIIYPEQTFFRAAENISEQASSFRAAENISEQASFFRVAENISFFGSPNGLQSQSSSAASSLSGLRIRSPFAHKSYYGSVSEVPKSGR
ncbi:MAG: hypothetical protein IJJ38_09140, partial [Lachnospiraceae bacterium]|nr:hypothetical protein [Lachnospiraceae bacterium]